MLVTEDLLTSSMLWCEAFDLGQAEGVGCPWIYRGCRHSRSPSTSTVVDGGTSGVWMAGGENLHRSIPALDRIRPSGYRRARGLPPQSGSSTACSGPHAIMSVLAAPLAQLAVSRAEGQ